MAIQGPIRALTDWAIGEIGRLQPVSFRMKAADYLNGDPNFHSMQIGLIAENVAAVDPRCTIYEDDMKTPKSYRPECITALLVKASQEQQQEIVTLRKQVNAIGERAR